MKRWRNGVKKLGCNMKIFIIERKLTSNFYQYYRVVVLAEDAEHAERKARLSNDDFRKDKNLNIIEVDMDKEQVLVMETRGYIQLMR